MVRHFLIERGLEFLACVVPRLAGRKAASDRAGAAYKVRLFFLEVAFFNRSRVVYDLPRGFAEPAIDAAIQKPEREEEKLQDRQ